MDRCKPRAERNSDGALRPSRNRLIGDIISTEEISRSCNGVECGHTEGVGHQSAAYGPDGRAGKHAPHAAAFLLLLVSSVIAAVVAAVVAAIVAARTDTSSIGTSRTVARWKRALPLRAASSGLDIEVVARIRVVLVNPARWQRWQTVGNRRTRRCHWWRTAVALVPVPLIVTLPSVALTAVTLPPITLGRLLLVWLLIGLLVRLRRALLIRLLVRRLVALLVVAIPCSRGLAGRLVSSGGKCSHLDDRPSAGCRPRARDCRTSRRAS